MKIIPIVIAAIAFVTVVAITVQVMVTQANVGC